MQTSSAEHGGERNFLTSPRAAFLALAAIVVVGGLWFASQGTNPDRRAEEPAVSPFDSISEQEAIQVFRDLSQAHRRAYRFRDLTLIESTFVPGTKVWLTTHNEIQRLLDDGVLDLSKYKPLKIDVVRLTSNEIEIREETLVRPHFESEKGADLTKSKSSLVQNARWVLEINQGEWRIADAVLLSSEANE